MATAKALPENLQLGPFQLHVGQKVLLREGHPVPLAPRAVEVLAVLAAHANQIVSKDELMAAVWPDTFVEEVNLAVHISALRKLLAGAESRIQIDTIPKRGYRLRGEIRPAPSEAPPESSQTAVAPPESTPGLAPDSIPAAAAPQVGTGDSHATALPQRLGSKAMAVAALAVVLLVAAGVWLDRWANSPRGGVNAGGARIQSLAVLPLDNLSGDPRQDYFAAGITDELTTELAHIHGLRVVSRTSASQFQGGRHSLPEIARALSVEGVIEGSVVRSGNRVRITTQLIEAASDRHLWAGTYEDSVDEVIALQDRLARDVAREVRAAVRPESAPPSISARGRQPVDRQAYDDYLQGLYAWNRRDQRTFDTAIEYFSRAAHEDPHFASAFASQAGAYILYALNGGPSAKYGPLARQAALEALAQDPDSAEAHAALAATSAVFEWDWAKSATEFQRAIDLDPNYATGHQWYADFYLVPELRLNEAEKELETALTLDPLSPIMFVDHGWVRYLQGDYPQARQEFDRALAADPDFVPAHFRLEGWYVAQGRDAGYARSVAENARLNGGNDALARAVEEEFARDGIRGLARAMLENDRRRGVLTGGVVAAQYYTMLGNAGGACAVLESAVPERDITLLFLNVDPRYAPLRALPCYNAVIQQMGLPRSLSPSPASPAAAEVVSPARR